MYVRIKTLGSAFNQPDVMGTEGVAMIKFNTLKTFNDVHE